MSTYSIEEIITPMYNIGEYKLTGAAIDTLFALYNSPRDDGDLPSKNGMYDLIELGLAVKDYTYEHPNFLTSEAVLLIDNYYKNKGE